MSVKLLSNLDFAAKLNSVEAVTESGKEFNHCPIRRRSDLSVYSPPYLSLCDEAVPRLAALASRQANRPTCCRYHFPTNNEKFLLLHRASTPFAGAGVRQRAYLPSAWHHPSIGECSFEGCDNRPTTSPSGWHTAYPRPDNRLHPSRPYPHLIPDPHFADD